MYLENLQSGIHKLQLGEWVMCSMSKQNISHHYPIAITLRHSDPQPHVTMPDGSKFYSFQSQRWSPAYFWWYILYNVKSVSYLQQFERWWYNWNTRSCLIGFPHSSLYSDCSLLKWLFSLLLPFLSVQHLDNPWQCASLYHICSVSESLGN